MDEMMQFTRNQIMTQSSIAMLAQANQAPTEVMNLIG
jgi:flagellin-like hook-associated protein FlgL